MKPIEIRILLMQRGLTIEKIATDIDENRVAVSQTINYLRPNERIRKKLSKYLKIPQKQLFDSETKCGPANAKQRSIAAA